MKLCKFNAIYYANNKMKVMHIEHNASKISIDFGGGTPCMGARCLDMLPLVDLEQCKRTGCGSKWGFADEQVISPLISRVLAVIRSKRCLNRASSRKTTSKSRIISSRGVQASPPPAS